MFRAERLQEFELPLCKVSVRPCVAYFRLCNAGAFRYCNFIPVKLHIKMLSHFRHSQASQSKHFRVLDACNYNPSTGRFLSEDPIGLDGADPSGNGGLPPRSRVSGGGSFAFAWHEHEIEEGNTDMKLIGVYSTHELAKEAQERVSKLSGFKDFAENCEIGISTLDRDNWVDGFVTVK